MDFIFFTTYNVKKTYQIVKIDEIVGLPGNFGKR